MAKADLDKSHYPTTPYHAVRVCQAVSSIIVTGILIYFSYHLKTDGFKIPWTFLINLAASVFTLISLITSSLIQCCGRVSPLLNVLTNIPLLLLWIIALALLCRNIYGVLHHSCNLSVWAVNDGVTVCQTYKGLFSFIVIAGLLQLAQVVLDVRARRLQVQEGKYNRMDATKDIKLEPTTNTSNSLDKTYSPSQAEFRDEVGWRPRGNTNEGKDNSITTSTEVYPSQDARQQHRTTSGVYHHSTATPYADPGTVTSQHADFHPGSYGNADRYEMPSSNYPAQQYQAFSYASQSEQERPNQYPYDYSVGQVQGGARYYSQHEYR